MSTSITYDPKTREVEHEEDPRDKRYLIYVWGEEGDGDGFLAKVRFGGTYKIETHRTHDPKKGMHMPLKKALSLLTRLDDMGFRANLFCFPSVTVYQ